MGQLFGTDGVRSMANTAPLTAEMVLAIGRAAAYVCKRHDKRHRIVIGKDTRLSGYMIENALTAGICSMGVDALLIGPMPTPGIAFITHSMRADAGIVISASHNPYHDNGIKIFSPDGYKLSNELENEIEALMASGKIDNIRPTAEDIGKAYRIDDARGRYIEFCKKTFPDDLTLDGLRIVIDCANGSTYKVAPTIFSELGAEVTTIHNQPNGRNINDNCGSQFTHDLSARVIQTGADLGLAFDGDGDRLIAVDERGSRVDGDLILTICANFMADRGQLHNNLVVITPMTNIGARLALDEMRIRYEESEVGDKNVLRLMKKNGAVLGGEQSGHIIVLSKHTTGDGIISALQFLAVVKQSGQKLSEMTRAVRIAPQKLVNVKVREKPPLEDIKPVQNAIRKAEAELGRQGRVLVRYSGTQELCRVMVEGPTDEMVGRVAAELADTLREAIGCTE